MPISILIYLKLNDDEGTHTNAVAKITHSPQLCYVLNNQIPEGRKFKYQETRSICPIFPTLTTQEAKLTTSLKSAAIHRVNRIHWS